MYGVIIGIAVVIIAILILLVLVILPPAVFLNPPSAEIGTDFNVNAFFFTPGEIVTVSIIRTADNQTIDTDAHAVNAVGVLAFSFTSSNLSVGDYSCAINSSRGDIVRAFTLITRVNPVPGGTVGPVTPGPNNNLLIEPSSGLPGMTIKITANSLKPDCRVTVKAVNCLNDICTDNQTVYIRHGDQECDWINAELRVRVHLTKEQSGLVSDEDIFRKYPGAWSTKIERIIIPEERLRSEDIMTAVALSEKIKEWAMTVNRNVSPEVLEIANEVEQRVRSQQSEDAAP